MKHFLFIFAIILALGSCKKDDPEEVQLNPCGIDFETSLKYAAIGDEFSIGLHLQDEEAWPFLVQAYLNEHGYPETDLTFIGENGLTCADLSTFISGNSDANCKNIATVMVGVHDQLVGRTAAQFRTDLTALLNQVKGLVTGTGRITCVTLPDYSATPGLPASAGTPTAAKAVIEAYNAVIEEVCSDLNIGVANIYPISEPSYPIMYVPQDEFHADSQQHELWANVVSNIVENQLD